MAKLSSEALEFVAQNRGFVTDRASHFARRFEAAGDQVAVLRCAVELRKAGKRFSPVLAQRTVWFVRGELAPESVP